jgi:hypothetical protein
MKSSFIKMNKFMPLLTDTLPYEVPILFSNYGFYETIETAYKKYYDELVRKKAAGKDSGAPKTIEDFMVDEFILGEKLSQLREKIVQLFEKPLLPYEYTVVKNQKKRRRISLIHPIAQIKICDFYAKHKNEILFHATRNDVSLRHPIKVASRILRPHSSLIAKLNKEEEQVNCNDPRDVLEDNSKFDLKTIPNNYFVYSSYSYIHEFYTSPEFLKLEQRFCLCLKFDINRCFESIYTHSIAWALKDKEYIKKHKKYKNTFEYEIDKLVQNSNWGETHGIPVGSEFSRIFAEIILQRIDQNVEIKLESSDFKVNGSIIRKGFDFKIRRYVDDFFVFVNNNDVAEAIKKVYEDELADYKLYLNQDKQETLNRPFITKITSAKQKISQKFKQILQWYHSAEKHKIKLDIQNLFANIDNCYKTTKQVIEEIRITIYNNNIEMIDISNIILASLKKELYKILDIFSPNKFDSFDFEIQKRISKGIKIYLNDLLDISFYVFHLCLKPSATYKICTICLATLDILKYFDNEKISTEIKQKIYSQLLLYLENIKQSNTPLTEFIDVIGVISELGNNFFISVNRLENDILKPSLKNLTYFEIVVLLSYIKNQSNYEDLKIKLLNRIKEKLNNTEKVFLMTETFMLFFDIVSCPYVDENYKKEILGIVGLKNYKTDIIEFISKRKWFFAWNEKLTLKKLIETKELRKAY